MNVQVQLTLTAEDIQKLPYQLICETRSGAVWDTLRRKRLWNEEFTKEEQEMCEKLCKQAHKWALKTGAPSSLKMTTAEYYLWHRLGAFCGKL